MAKTRAERHEDQQQRIIETAARLFAERTFTRTSIAELARACGFSKPLLYHYFDSKEDVLYRMLQAHMRDLRAALVGAHDSSDDAEGRFRAFVSASLSVYTAVPEKHVVLMHDLDCLPEPQRAEIVAAERELVELVADMLAALRPELNADRRLRKPYAMMFYGLLNWTYIWYNPDGPVPPAEFAQRACDTFLNGFLPTER